MFDINVGQFPGLKLCQCVNMKRGVAAVLPCLREREKGGEIQEERNRTEGGERAVMYASM